MTSPHLGKRSGGDQKPSFFISIRAIDGGFQGERDGPGVKKLGFFALNSNHLNGTENIVANFNKEILYCRVCGLKYEEPPWGIDGKTPSFEICECCGVEFGYEDGTVTAVKRYRAKWISSGAT